MVNKDKIVKLISCTKTLKILYVEDNEDSRNQALKLFQNYFSYIDVATDGEEGLEYYKNYFLDNNQYYDLVITDIQMPNMDGISLSKLLYEINKEQKILILSGYNDKKHLIDLINLGVEGFIQKPLSFDQVLDAMKNVTRSFIDESIIQLASNCSYNMQSKQFSQDDDKIDLTKNEHKFIEFLIKNNNQTSELKDIFNYIYYDEPQKKFTADSIKGLIKRLRKKLPDNLIVNNRVKGYYIQDQ